MQFRTIAASFLLAAIPFAPLNATIHLATGAQTVDVGPLFVVNLGQE